jgi:hypothetical protein
MDDTPNGIDQNARATNASTARQKQKPKTTEYIIITAILIIALIALIYYFASTLKGTGSASTTIISTSFAGPVLCTPSSSQFACGLSDKPVLHNYSISVNSSTVIVYGTFVNLYLTQTSGSDWSNVNIAFVPQGTASNNGVPEVNFNPQNQLGYAGVMTNGTQNLVLFIPVSNSTSGMFKGQLWAQYHNGFANATPVYADIANITINAST